MVRLPNFFIIGAPKCGTTSLAAWLAEHPNVYMSPIKEPLFFSSDIGHRWVITWDEYVRLFEEVKPEHIAVGEASVFYLFSRIAVPTIEERLPESRYIVMVRNPIEMVYSWHQQLLRSHQENIEDFYMAWRLASKRRGGQRIPRWCKDPILLDYPSWGRLGEQLERLYATVPKERVLVLVLDDVKADPRREYLRVLKFLGIPDDGRQQFPVHNPARMWRFRRLGKIIHAYSRLVVRFKRLVDIPLWQGPGVVERLSEAILMQKFCPLLTIEVRRELAQYFAEDIRLLERLLGRDLSAWKHEQVNGVPEA